jgi:hypothetical protein
MATQRLSRLHQHILQWLALDQQRTKGFILSSHEERVKALRGDKGTISRNLRTLEARGWLVIGRSPGGKAQHLTKPCHHFLYSGGAFARLYSVNPILTRNYAAKTKRRPRVRSKSALDIWGLMSVPYSRLKAPRM